MLKHLTRFSGLAFGIVLAGATLAAAQSPMYQWINAAPTVAAGQDSVYFCEDGTFIGDFPGFDVGATYFRGAEGFFGPGSPGTKVIAASTSMDCADDNIVASVSVDVAADKNYQFILTGVHDPSMYPANPEGGSTELAFVVNDEAVVMGTPGLVTVSLAHAAPDVPDVTGIVPLTGTVLPLGPFQSVVSGLPFPSLLGEVLVEIHSEAVLAAGDSLSPLAKALVNLPLLDGQAVTALATGFANPPVGKTAADASYKTIGVLADGTVVELLPPPVDVTVEFAIDMSVEITTGNFNPETDIVTVAGSMNGWSTTADTLLPDFTDPTLFTKFIDLDSVQVAALAKGDVFEIQYKYVTGVNLGAGETPSGWESVDNRIITITGNEEVDSETGRLIVTQADVPTYNDADINDFFANDMMITFAVDMRPAFYHVADSGAMPIDIQTSEATTFDMGVWANGPLAQAPGGWATWGPGNLDQIDELKAHDDGATGGDLTAGDSVYTFQVSYTAGLARVGDMKYGTDGYDNESTFEGNHKLTLPDDGTGAGFVELIFGAMEQGDGTFGDDLYDPYINRKRDGTAEVVRRGGENDEVDQTTVSADLEFAVDMSVEITTGNFNPETDIVTVAGSMNGWSTTADTLLPDFTDPTLYTTVITIDSIDVSDGTGKVAVPDTFQYKYVTGVNLGAGETPSGWESVDNRLIIVTGDEDVDPETGNLIVTQAEIPTYNDADINDFFANDMTITFAVDMRPAYYHVADSGAMPIDIQTSEATTFDNGVWANGPLSKAPGGWATWGPGNLDQIDELKAHDDGTNGGDAVAGDSIFTFMVAYTAGEPRVGDLKYGTDGYDNESTFEGNHKLSLPDDDTGAGAVSLIFGAMEDGAGGVGDALYDPYICTGGDAPTVVRRGGDEGCDESSTAIEPVASELPSEISLGDNYPNPFNPTTTFEYSITEATHVKVDIYDLTGRLVQSLVNDVQPASRYRVTFDSNGLASGVYIYQLTTADMVISKKMLLLK